MGVRSEGDRPVPASALTTKRKRRKPETVERLKIVFAFSIAAIWMLATLVSMITKEYAVLTAISPVMMTVSGFLFGLKGHDGETA